MVAFSEILSEGAKAFLISLKGALKKKLENSNLDVDVLLDWDQSDDSVWNEDVSKKCVAVWSWKISWLNRDFVHDKTLKGFECSNTGSSVLNKGID